MVDLNKFDDTMGRMAVLCDYMNDKTRYNSYLDALIVSIKKAGEMQDNKSREEIRRHIIEDERL